MVPQVFESTNGLFRVFGERGDTHDYLMVRGFFRVERSARGAWGYIPLGQDKVVLAFTDDFCSAIGRTTCFATDLSNEDIRLLLGEPARSSSAYVVDGNVSAYAGVQSGIYEFDHLPMTEDMEQLVTYSGILGVISPLDLDSIVAMVMGQLNNGQVTCRHLLSSIREAVDIGYWFSHDGLGVEFVLRSELGAQLLRHVQQWDDRLYSTEPALQQGTWAWNDDHLCLEQVG